MKTVRVDRQGGIAIVTLDRPPVNAVNRRMQIELAEVFDELGDDRSVGSVVLAAAGERAFCAGIDLKEMSTAAADDVDDRERTNPGLQWRATQHAIRHCSVPVIAAVERVAIGAGFGIVGVCDLIVASTTASFGLTEINVGMLGGASKAIRLLGPHKARMMMFSGEIQSAELLHHAGAVEALTPPGEALSYAIGLAESFAAKSPIALRLAKESILRIEGDVSEQQYRTEWDYTNRLHMFNDSREAMLAFVEKRDPTWTWS